VWCGCARVAVPVRHKCVSARARRGAAPTTPHSRAHCSATTCCRGPDRISPAASSVPVRPGTARCLRQHHDQAQRRSMPPERGSTNRRRVAPLMCAAAADALQPLAFSTALRVVRQRRALLCTCRAASNTMMLRRDSVMPSLIVTQISHAMHRRGTPHAPRLCPPKAARARCLVSLLQPPGGPSAATKVASESAAVLSTDRALAGSAASWVRVSRCRALPRFLPESPCSNCREVLFSPARPSPRLRPTRLQLAACGCFGCAWYGDTIPLR
jgi:hypothetical protein